MNNINNFIYRDGTVEGSLRRVQLFMDPNDGNSIGIRYYFGDQYQYGYAMHFYPSPNPSICPNKIVHRYLSDGNWYDSWTISNSTT